MAGRSILSLGSAKLLVALLVAACAAAPATPGPAQPASSGPLSPARPTITPTETPTAAPTRTPSVGLNWTQVIDADLASAPEMGQMSGVIAGGPGAIAWGARWGPPGANGGRPALGPEIWTTVDGRDWTSATVERPSEADGAAPGEVIDITAVKPGFVAIGSYFREEYGFAILVWTSSDGRTWQRVPDQASFDHSSMHQVMVWDGRLVAFGCTLVTAVDCGADAVWFSDDGRAWEKAALSLPAGMVSVGLVARGTARLWGVGADDSGIAPTYQAKPPKRLTSVDGRTWTPIALPVLGIERLHPLADGLYVTVSQIPTASADYEPPAAWVSRTAGVFRSLDLVTWQPLLTGVQAGGEIIAVDDTLVMVGATGSRCWIPANCLAGAWRSTDGGRTWDSAPVRVVPTAGMPGAQMTSVAALADGTLVAVGFVASPDGTPATASWVSLPQPGR